MNIRTNTVKQKKVKSQYILRWAKKIKAINILGGLCKHCSCGDPRVLEFHHLDSSKKDMCIGDELTNSWDNIINEIDKCILLCKRCHSIEHNSSDSIIDTKGRENKRIILEFSCKKKCEECDWTGHQCGLEFHHLDSNEKEFCLSHITHRLTTVDDIEKYVIDEINKCQLLCCNCHKIKHVSSDYELYKKEIDEKIKNIKVYKKLDHNKITSLYKSGISITELSKKFDTSKSSIHYIINK